MQQLEVETALLKSGLEMVDSARDWYNRQLVSLADNYKAFGTEHVSV